MSGATAVSLTRRSRSLSGKDLDNIIRRMSNLADKASYYINDPKEISDLRINGYIKFKNPVPISNLVLRDPYDHVLSVVIANSISLKEIEFPDIKAHAVVYATISVSNGQDVSIKFLSYTEATAFLLRNEVLEALREGKVEFTSPEVEEFIASVMQYVSAIVRKGLHKYVDMNTMFSRAWLRGWRYIIEWKGEYDVEYVGLENYDHDNYIILMDRFFYQVDRVGIGKMGKAEYKLSRSEVAKLPVISVLANRFNEVKEAVSNYLELAKIAYLGVKAYGT